MIDEVEFVKTVITELVDNKNDVQVHKTIDDQGTLLTIFVNPTDIGKVIGKQGACISSLRTIIRYMFNTQEGKQVFIKLHDPREVAKSEKIIKDIDTALSEIEDSI